MTGLDPLARRLMDLAAGRGCVVERRPLFPYFRGLYLNDPGTAPRILLDQDLEGVDLALVLAHELGHHCTGSPGCWNVAARPLRGSYAWIQRNERRAGRFARLLLRLVARGLPPPNEEEVVGS